MCIKFFLLTVQAYLSVNKHTGNSNNLKFSVKSLNFLRFDICAKPNFAQKGKSCSRLLEPTKLLPTVKVTQTFPSAIGTGLMATPFTNLGSISSFESYRSPKQERIKGTEKASPIHTLFHR